MGVFALLQLAKWWQKRLKNPEGEASCPQPRMDGSPPAHGNADAAICDGQTLGGDPGAEPEEDHSGLGPIDRADIGDAPNDEGGAA